MLHHHCSNLFHTFPIVSLKNNWPYLGATHGRPDAGVVTLRHEASGGGLWPRLAPPPKPLSAEAGAVAKLS